MSDIRLSQAPEAIAYLRLLGNEMGYMKVSEMRKVAETLFMYYHIFIRILPAQVRPTYHMRICKKRIPLWVTDTYQRLVLQHTCHCY